MANKGYHILSLEAKDIYEQEQINGVEKGYLLPSKKDHAYFGRAITGNGIFTRMSQYYRMKEKDGALKYITEENKDKIEVWYFNLESNRDCWAAEKYLQAKAYYAGEEMEWDDEVHQDS